MYQNILVPIDGSPTAGYGLREAIKLARALGSRMRVVHVVTGAAWIDAESAAVPVGEILSRMHEYGESILEEAARIAESAGVTAFEPKLIEAFGQQASECILEEARAWPAHLVICGTHGRRGLRRILLGSDAEHIVRSSAVPVLLVRGS
ncbi:MAG: universal stress protein [Steroidobacteraceae bacterium]